VANATPALAGGIFEVEQADDTLIVVPAADLWGLGYQRIEAGAKQLLELLNGTGAKNVVVDCGKTDYYGSSTLGLFLKLWKMVRRRHGRTALCHVSDHEREVLQITNLDRSWPIYPSRGEALAAVKGKQRLSAY
jgi:anti-anti-sigma factor